MFALEGLWRVSSSAFSFNLWKRLTIPTESHHVSAVFNAGKLEQNGNHGRSLPTLTDSLIYVDSDSFCMQQKIEVQIADKSNHIFELNH